MNAQIRNLQECYKFCEAIAHKGRREVVQHAILLGLEILAKEPHEIRQEVDLLAMLAALNDVLSAPKFVELLTSSATTAEGLTLAAFKVMLSHDKLGGTSVAMLLAFVECIFAKPSLVRNLMGITEDVANWVIATKESGEWISERDLKQLEEDAARPVPPEIVELLKAEREKCLAFVAEFSKVFGPPLTGETIQWSPIVLAGKDGSYRRIKFLENWHETAPLHNEQVEELLAKAVENQLTEARIYTLATCIGAASYKIAQVSIVDALNGDKVSLDWNSFGARTLSGVTRRDTN